MPRGGIEKLPWARIPTEWDPVWFTRIIREVFALADIRNAIEGDGISISGTPDVPATISASADILALSTQPYVLATSSAFLPNERILTGQSGTVSITDGGPGNPITVGVLTGGISNEQLRQSAAWSVIGRTQDSAGTVFDIPAAVDGDVLRLAGTRLQFGDIVLRASNFANPSAVVGAAAVNGSAITAMRSDAAPALDPAYVTLLAGSALTKTDDTNVTLTLGGTPATSLLRAASLTVGWTGTLAATRGGTGTGTYATGDILYASGVNTLAKLVAGSDTYILTLASGVPTWAAPPAGTMGANPSASVGLTAVNGVATTFLRSDGAPALNQGIAPTWTNQHNFTRSWSSGLEGAWQVASAFPMTTFYETGASANNARWAQYAVGEAMTLALGNDAATSFRGYFTVARSGIATTAMTYGNSTDNPTHTFYGSIIGNVQHNAGAATGAASSGTYTPTLTNTTNLSATTARACQWMRVGNVVTVSGSFNATPTIGGVTCIMGMTLPIASALANAFELGGGGGVQGGGNVAMAAYGDATNDRATFAYLATVGANEYAFSFTYQVL